MAWLILIASGILEAAWATALKKSDGFSRLGASLVFLVSVALSMTGLAIAMRTLPVGTSYAVWVGVGAVLTVGYTMLIGDEPASSIKLVLIGGIVACVAGLKLSASDRGRSGGRFGKVSAHQRLPALSRSASGGY
jgi:quaternary ammonium compound-resistance protein SugE